MLERDLLAVSGQCLPDCAEFDAVNSSRYAVVTDSA
jgi:hypothetical protein